MENTPPPSESNNTVMIFLWIVSLLAVGVISYGVGKMGNNNQSTLGAATGQTPIQAVAQDTPTPTPVNLGGLCPKNGPSQKKDYLKPYTLKDGDTINSIAETQLGSVSRNTEITTLNQDQKQLMVGSVIYLPPDTIKSSSGNIAQVSGKLVRKDTSYWQLSYGEKESDLGVLMPAYWFKDITGTGTFNIGDCVSILFDNGVKAYAVTKQ